MPVRLLRATLRTSERWNRCSFIEQSFYIRLITIADDFGRYEAHAGLLSSECFPYGDDIGLPVPKVKIEGMLRSLASKDLIMVYESEGKQFLQLTRWNERVRAKTSRYPDPNGCKEVWKCQSNDWQMSDNRLSDVGNPESSQPTDKKEVTKNVRQMPADCGQMLASPPSPSPSPSPSPVRNCRFAPPSIEEVKLQSEKIGLPEIQWRLFMAYYEANGWKVGRNGMKSWTAALTKWKLTWQEGNNGQAAGITRRNPQENPRNVGVCPGTTDYAAASKKIVERQRQERLAKEMAQTGGQASSVAGP